MRDLTRLNTGARLSNSDDGMILVNLEPFIDGGFFDLHAKQLDDGIILVDPARPSGYGVYIRGDVDSLDKVSKALATVVRKLKSDDSDTDGVS